MRKLRLEIKGSASFFALAITIFIALVISVFVLALLQYEEQKGFQAEALLQPVVQNKIPITITTLNNEKITEHIYVVKINRAYYLKVGRDYIYIQDEPNPARKNRPNN